MTEPFDLKVASLRRKYTGCGNKIKAINEAGRVAKTDKAKIPEFRGAFRNLDRLYQKCEDIWDELHDVYDADGKGEEYPSTKDANLQANIERYFNEACTNYESIGRFEEKLQTQLRRPSSSSEPLLGSHSYSYLPKMNLPQFNGELTQWPKFRDAFLSMIHDDPNIPSIRKFHYLITSVSGTAQSVVNKLPLQAENYPIAWKALMDSYDNKRLLASSYLNELINFKPFQGRSNIQNLQLFLTKVSENISALKLLKIPQESEFILYHLAIKCLDQQTREQFELQHHDTPFPTFDALTEFIRNRCLALQLSDHKSQTDSYTKSSYSNSHRVGYRSDSDRKYKGPNQTAKTSLLSSKGEHSRNKSPQQHPKPPKIPTCPVCNQYHHILNCLKFTEAKAPQRLQFLKGWKGCRNCLSHNHQTKSCTSKWHCRFCDLRHHSLLHLENQPKQSENSETPDPDIIGASSSNALSSTVQRGGTQVLLGTAVVEIKDARECYQPIRIVVDSGSQSSFITQKCLNKLGLNASFYPRKIAGIGGTMLEDCKGKVSVSLKAKNGVNVLETHAIVVSKITSNLPNMRVPEHICKPYASFELADPLFWKPGPIDFLLGCDLFSDIITGSPIRLIEHLPNLFPSIFGYIIIGKIKTTCHESIEDTTLFVRDEDPDLRTELCRFWEIEEVTRKTIEDPEEAACETHFVQTHYRIENGRYVVRLPFKGDRPIFKNTETQAMNRFQRLESKLSKTPVLKAQYSEFMHEYMNLEHMSPTDSQSDYIIPHHSVVKEDRGAIKLRVVFDASFKSAGESLNDHLMVGPKLQTDIRDILLNFRRHYVVFVTDVVKMYRNILLDPQDRSYQHIFWRFKETDGVQKYELNTLTYGLTSAPYLALRVLKQLIEDEGNQFPKAAQSLCKDMYIDDLVTGSDTVSNALELQKEVIGLLSQGGFALSKWASNRQEILSKVMSTSQHDPVNLSTNDPGIKILGLIWNPQNDCFSYSINAPPIVYSKRAILSTIARIYDPLGFLSPVVVLAKLIIQDLWKAEIGWDDEIPASVQKDWTDFVTELRLLSRIQIPRFVFSSKPYTYQIIGFCDASNKAYSASIYIRVVTGDEVRTALVVAKTKLAPVKSISIPRLELCGALLLARLYSSMDRFISDLSRKPDNDPHFFTDSTVVLSWINTPAFKLKTFVANRVTEILEKTISVSWKHVPSEENPSDCSSRGILPERLIKHDLWWQGPNWFRLPPSEWPTHCNAEVFLPEIKTEYEEKVNVLTTTKEEPYIIKWISKQSSYSFVLRVIAWCLRWSQRFKCKDNHLHGPLTSDELQRSLASCAKLIQEYHFDNDPSDTNNTFTLKKFQNLNPFVGQDGVLRVGGRIRKADVPTSQKHPILLPPKCHFVTLMIDYYHKSYLHPGPSLLQALIQLKFWIPSLRHLVRKRTFMCVRCFKIKAKQKNLTPFMGDLPKSRLTPGRAFLHVGVDFAGPFQIRESLRRKANTSKAYLCLFVCMATKALHLELVTSLSTEAFLACLSRFISRRGLCQVIYSDQGTNFVGAANKLKELHRWFKEETTKNCIVNYANDRGITWKFNPPHAPHFGGLWEAGVKSAKRILTTVAGDTPLTYEELSTLFSKVEAVLNSRPLHPISASPNENEFLSPGHFLIGGHLLANPEPTLLDLKENTLSRWQLVSRMSESFWKRWKQEYLSTLQSRSKWNKQERNLQKGDLVIIKDPSVPYLHWPTARVIDVHPGDDNVVRVVTLQVGKSIYKRPVVQVVPILPLQVPSFDTS